MATTFVPTLGRAGVVIVAATATALIRNVPLLTSSELLCCRTVGPLMTSVLLVFPSLTSVAPTPLIIELHFSLERACAGSRRADGHGAAALDFERGRAAARSRSSDR